MRFKKMKKLIQLSTAVFVSIVITACGGGTDTAGTNPPPSKTAGKLIIDSGRGTVNNQDTESPRQDK